VSAATLAGPPMAAVAVGPLVRLPTEPMAVAMGSSGDQRTEHPPTGALGNGAQHARGCG